MTGPNLSTVFYKSHYIVLCTLFSAVNPLLFSEDSLFNLKISIDWPIKIEHSERQFYDGKIIRDAQIFLTV